MAHNKWLESEKEFVRNNYKTMSDEEMHKYLINHSVCSIATWRKRNGCYIDNPYHKKYTFQDVLSYMNDYGYEVISSETEYQNAGSPIRYRCNIHNDIIQTTTLGHLIEGKKCRYCGINSAANKRYVDLAEYKQKDKERCVELGFEYVDTIRESTSKNISKLYVTFICPNHVGVGVQKMTRGNIYRDVRGCAYCTHHKFEEGELMEICKENSPHIKIITLPVLRKNQRVDCECSKHGILRNVLVRDIAEGSCCYQCGIEKLSNKSLLSDDEVIAAMKKYHPNAELITKYTGSKDTLLFRCNKCGCEYSGHLHIPKRCPSCEHYYWGEKHIQNYLESHGINYIPQHRFIDCKNKRPLPFDFYLPNLNICIEYQGKQHYEPCDWFGGNESFLAQKRNDKIKKDYCNANGIELIEIDYRASTYQHIEKILSEKI